MPKIVIHTKPHSKQRYKTVGDYYFKGKTLHVNISQSKPDYEFLVLIHELIEWYLTHRRGVKIKEIDDFDTSFKGKGEPGDSVQAPYFIEHQYATIIEKMLAFKMSINWDKYERHLNSL